MVIARQARLVYPVELGHLKKVVHLGQVMKQAPLSSVCRLSLSRIPHMGDDNGKV